MHFLEKFNVCSKRVLLSWIDICRDLTLQTQIFTQKYRSWLRFYSGFLGKKLAAEGSGYNLTTILTTTWNQYWQNVCQQPWQHSWKQSLQQSWYLDNVYSTVLPMKEMYTLLTIRTNFKMMTILTILIILTMLTKYLKHNFLNLYMVSRDASAS